ncbi:hypothetical protein LTR17_008033 [Elasticomyces elasticus]|nr:hypothetical protein LTR17_008033 [Elasticomyces elasticus]
MADVNTLVADLMAAAHSLTGPDAQEQRDTLVALYSAIKNERKVAGTALQGAKRAAEDAKAATAQTEGTASELETVRMQHQAALQAAESHGDKAQAALHEAAVANEQVRAATEETRIANENVYRVRSERDQKKRDLQVERDKHDRLQWEADQAARLRSERDGLRQEMHALRQQISSQSTSSGGSDMSNTINPLTDSHTPAPTRVSEKPVRGVAAARPSISVSPNKGGYAQCEPITID